MGPRWCAACGPTAELVRHRCPKVDAFPLAWSQERGGRTVSVVLACPFACPICGTPLEWDGACKACYGSRTRHRRETWTIPGDRYMVDDAHPGHYVLDVKGPQPVASEAEAMAAIAKIKALLRPKFGELGHGQAAAREEG